MNYDQQYNRFDLQSKSRTKFVNKVYSLLSVQLSVTAAFVCLNIYSAAFARLQQTSTILWVLALIAVFGTLLPLTFSPNLGKSFPTNMIMLGIFTLGESYLVSCITTMYEPQSVLMCAIATAGATIGITFYAMTTKKDFTEILHLVGAVFSGAFWIFLFLSIFNVFFFQSSFLVNLQAFVFALLYCVYIAIDTQLILGGKNKQLTLDNYVMGAMLLYVDIIGLFLKLLQLLGDKKKK